MRPPKDRFRHAVFFEFFGFGVLTPLTSRVLDRSLGRIWASIMAVSLLAVVANTTFDLVSDHVLGWAGCAVDMRPPWLHVLRGAFFVVTLLVIDLPLVAWWLDLPHWQAFLTDVGFVLFFLAYSHAYDRVYDWVFPIPTAERDTEG